MSNLNRFQRVRVTVIGTPTKQDQQYVIPSNVSDNVFQTTVADVFDDAASLIWLDHDNPNWIPMLERLEDGTYQAMKGGCRYRVEPAEAPVEVQ